jgi:hypothetical protein
MPGCPGCLPDWNAAAASISFRHSTKPPAKTINTTRCYRYLHFPKSSIRRELFWFHVDACLLSKTLITRRMLACSSAGLDSLVLQRQCSPHDIDETFSA